MDKQAIFKRVAEVAAQSPAVRRKVGAIIVDSSGEELVSAYNHNNGQPCEDEYGNTYDTVIHAEVAACLELLEQRDKADFSQFKLYVTHQPCIDCETTLASLKLEYEVVAEFLKFDGDKLRYDLVPPSLIKAVADVFTYGARKYKPNNWKNVDDPERYIAAAMRHWEAYRSGEKCDEESGKPHLGHLATNIAMLIELDYLPEQWK